MSMLCHKASRQQACDGNTNGEGLLSISTSHRMALLGTAQTPKARLAKDKARLAAALPFASQARAITAAAGDASVRNFTLTATLHAIQGSALDILK
eukprot:866225-Pleurochrysis_carterae.AAC.6